MKTKTIVDKKKASRLIQDERKDIQKRKKENALLVEEQLKEELLVAAVNVVNHKEDFNVVMRHFLSTLENTNDEYYCSQKSLASDYLEQFLNYAEEAQFVKLTSEERIEKDAIAFLQNKGYVLSKVE